MSRPEWAACEAALRGAREIALHGVSMSLSLIAVFVPILLMPGLIGRMFREFAVVLSVAILISMIVSLTTTPMMCAYLATDRPEARARMAYRQATAFSPRCCALRAHAGVGAALAGTRSERAGLVVALNVYLFIVVPKGLFPEQDTGRVVGGIRADQSASFELMQHKLTQFIRHSRQGSGGRQCHRLYRRRADECRVCLCRAETAGRARRVGRAGRRAAAAQARAGRRRAAVSAGGAGYPRRRAGNVRAIPVHAAVRRSGAALRVGAALDGRVGAAAATGRRQSPTSSRAGSKPGWRSTARPPRGSA